jgi:hypothetical protein
MSPEATQGKKSIGIMRLRLELFCSVEVTRNGAALDLYFCLKKKKKTVRS